MCSERCPESLGVSERLGEPRVSGNAFLPGPGLQRHETGGEADGAPGCVGREGLTQPPAGHRRSAERDIARRDKSQLLQGCHWKGLAGWGPCVRAAPW